MKAIDILVLGFAVLIGFVMMTSASGVVQSPTSGVKRGVVVKLAEEGIFVKTQEAELIRGGLTNGSGVAGGEVFTFTVSDPAVLQQIRQALDTGEEIEIKYERPLFSVPLSRQIMSNPFVTSVIPVRN
jgi:hypothetical protein